MLEAKVLNELLGINDSYKAPETLMNILYDRQQREHLMRDVLAATGYKVDEDMFRTYFEEEHSDRKKKKQDFTPPSIAKLTAALVGTPDNTGMFYEPCAGTGSMTIAQWHQDQRRHSPFDYKPSWYFYMCEELSDRAIPFLLFNLALRGMNAVVIQCDVLSRNAYGAFFIQNDKDDHMTFSSINTFPYNKHTEGLFAISFVEEKYRPLTESPADFWTLPAFTQVTERGTTSDLTKAMYAMCGIGELPKMENKQQVQEGQTDLFEFI